MFEKLFKRPSAIARQLEAPLASERASLLAQRAEEGAARDTLVRLSRELLVVVRELDLTSSYSITLAAVETAAERWARQQRRRRRARTLRWPRVFFVQTATAWLRYLGRLCTPQPPPKPFAPLVDAFSRYLTHERGLSPATTTNYQWHVEHFLTDFSTRENPFAEVRLEDTDAFLSRPGAH